MAIYHLRVRGIAPSRASSAVKSSAYISGERLYDERTGEVAEYARAERVVDGGLLLPDVAPRWDRQRLWNESMAAAVGRELASRSYEVALPRELDRARQRDLVLEFCAAFRSDDRACEWAIHDDGDGNPHAHILVSALQLGPDGFIASASKPRKSSKVYICRDADGTDVMVPAADWKAAKAAGVEKVYNFKDGARRTMTEAKREGLGFSDRKSKEAAAVTVMPDGARAFDVEKAHLVAERKRWADLVNAALESAGSDARVDHRSLADQGVNRLPTVHEGPVVRKIERAALIRAALAGVEYVPVTDARRRNLEVARGNGVLAAIERKLEAVVAAIKRFKTWWIHEPDPLEARRRKFILAHRARGMAAAAPVDPSYERPAPRTCLESLRNIAEAGPTQEGVDALAALYAEQMSALAERACAGPACWGEQVSLGDGRCVSNEAFTAALGFTPTSEEGRALAATGYALDAFARDHEPMAGIVESASRQGGVSAWVATIPQEKLPVLRTVIEPSMFSAEELKVMAEVRPDLFGAEACGRYPEAARAVREVEVERAREGARAARECNASPSHPVGARHEGGRGARGIDR